METVLITGGAGFVGSFLADELLAHGYRVRVLDSLDEQVHGGDGVPDYLSGDVEFFDGDVRDSEAVSAALRGVDAVCHLAALVGVGQSMYQIERYISVNNVGTAVLLECLAKRPPRRLMVASSMSIYGEGMYMARDGRKIEGSCRTMAQLQARDWEVRDMTGEALRPIPTPETKTPTLASVYALSKYDQERLCLVTGSAYGIEATALRFFNIYGPRQALSNPYTGVLAIFAARFLNNRAPLVNEDGQQQRDFVHVRDVARACRLALESPHAVGEVFNVGSGRSRSILDVACTMAAALNKEYIAPEIVGKYRVGDIRNCFADLSKSESLLGFRPEVIFEDGLAELASWLEGQVAVDQTELAGAELASRGLTV